MGQPAPDAMFASSSVPMHVFRGVVGLVAAVAAFALLGTIGPSSLLLLVVAVLAWRGCPTCWAVGLTRTKAARDAGAGCVVCPSQAPAKVRHWA